MKRRNLKSINGKPIPDEFRNADEIYGLLHYQRRFFSKLKRKMAVLIHQILTK